MERKRINTMKKRKKNIYIYLRDQPAVKNQFLGRTKAQSAWIDFHQLLEGSSGKDRNDREGSTNLKFDDVNKRIALRSLFFQKETAPRTVTSGGKKMTD